MASDSNPYRPPQTEAHLPYTSTRLSTLVLIPRNLSIVLCSLGVVLSLINHYPSIVIGGILISLGVCTMGLSVAIASGSGIRIRKSRKRAGWAAAILLIMFSTARIVSSLYSQQFQQQLRLELQNTKTQLESMNRPG